MHIPKILSKFTSLVICQNLGTPLLLLKLTGSLSNLKGSYLRPYYFLAGQIRRLTAAKTLTWHGHNKPLMDMNLALGHLQTLGCLTGHAVETWYF